MKHRMFALLIGIMLIFSQVAGIASGVDVKEKASPTSVTTLSELAEEIEGYEAVRIDPERFTVSADEAENVGTVVYRTATAHTPGDGTEP